MSGFLLAVEVAMIDMSLYFGTAVVTVSSSLISKNDAWVENRFQNVET